MFSEEEPVAPPPAPSPVPDREVPIPPLLSHLPDMGDVPPMSMDEYNRRLLVARRLLPAYREWVVIAANKADVPKEVSDKHTVYRISELDRIWTNETMRDDALELLHNVKSLFHGQILG